MRTDVPRPNQIDPELNLNRYSRAFENEPSDFNTFHDIDHDDFRAILENVIDSEESKRS